MNDPDPNDPNWIAFCTPSPEHEAKLRQWLTEHDQQQVRIIISIETDAPFGLPAGDHLTPALSSVGTLLHLDPAVAIGSIALEPAFFSHVSRVNDTARWIDMQIASGAIVRIEQHPLSPTSPREEAFG